MALLQVEELPTIATTTTTVIASLKTTIDSSISRATSLMKKIVLLAAIHMEEETIKIAFNITSAHHDIDLLLLL